MPSKGERLIRGAYEAFGDRDLERLSRLAHESVEIYTVTGLLAGREGPYVGREGIEAYLEDLAGTWERIELQPQQFTELEDGRTLVFGRVRAWHASGFVDASNAWVWTIEDERIRRVQVLADPNDARELRGEGDR